MLRTHADYHCRHSGACCTADWPISVGAVQHRQLLNAIEAGRLSAAIADPFVETSRIEDGVVRLPRTAEGRCSFFFGAGEPGCGIQLLGDAVERALDSLPIESRRSAHRRTWTPVVNRYLAAKLFASRVPYQSERVTALVDAIASAHHVPVGEARRACENGRQPLDARACSKRSGRRTFVSCIACRRDDVRALTSPR